MTEDSGIAEIAVGPDGIRLGQLLKLANLIDSGGAARGLLESGAVHVNGEAEVRRGRQLSAGDLVEAAGQRVRLS